MSHSHNNPVWSYLYIAWIGIVCIVLLILNFELVRMGLQGLPFFGSEARARQMLQFFLPIILIFIEFRTYDFLIDRSDRSDESVPTENREPR